VNSGFLLAELRTCSLDNVSEERLEAYVRICGTFCEWYFVLGSDEDMFVSWADCRECLAFLFKGCRFRFKKAGSRSEQARMLHLMCQCARLLRMGGDDRKLIAYEQSASRFFEEWEDAGFPRPEDFSEELDLLSLIYEDRQDCSDLAFSAGICGYYVRRMREILDVLLQHTPRTLCFDKITLLKSIGLLAKSRGSSLDLQRDMEIRRLCNLYMSDATFSQDCHEALMGSQNSAGEGLRQHGLLFVALQETLEACGGWSSGSLGDHCAAFISRTEGIFSSTSDEWWLWQSLWLRQRLMECIA